MSDLHAKRKAWLDGLYGRFSDRDKVLLDRASTTLVNNVCVPEAGQKFLWEPYRGICPSPTAYKGVWNWDSAFHMLAVSRWDPELANEQAYIFCDHQLPDGMFPDVIFADGRVVDSFSKPPVFPWACWEIASRSADIGFMKKVYAPMKKMLSFWETKRFNAGNGLFFYSGKEPWLESGWDNSVRWDEYMKRMPELNPVDLNCFMVMSYNGMKSMAEKLGEQADARAFSEKAKALAEKINATLWNGASYADYDSGNKTRSKVMSPAIFMPLYAGIADKDKAGKMQKIAADPNKFYPGMPTVSCDDPKYEAHHYWRGPCWMNTAYFAVKGLKDYGYDETADRMKETVLNWCHGTKEALHEYYDTKTGKGVGASNFGWTSVFVIEFILNY